MRSRGIRLNVDKMRKIFEVFGWAIDSRPRCKTHGVRFLVFPPVGPAVPLSQTQYVAPSVLLTFSARPLTTSSVGPLYDFTWSWVHPAKAMRDSSVYRVKPPLKILEAPGVESREAEMRPPAAYDGSFSHWLCGGI